MSSASMAVTTGGPWHGGVPLGWSLKQLKWAVTFQRGHDLPAEDRHAGPVPVVAGGGITGWHDVAQARGPGIVTGRYGTIGEFHLVEGDYWPLNTALYSIDLHGNHAGFLRYMLEPLTPLFHLNAAKSAVPGIDRSDIHTIPVAVPPPSTQHAIADYLDRETARLDALVAAKERVLELLAEKRRALITRAVTRGLDARSRLRDSGIPWLGEIPAHWELKRLKRIGRAIIGLTFDPADTVTDGSGVLVLRASNVRDQKIVLDDNLFVQMDIPEPLRTREGDILICSRSGSRALIGKNALIDQASAGLTFGAFMTIFRSPHNEYLFYIFNSPLFDYQAGAFSTSTINQLTVETLNGMEVPLPPPSEQEAIVTSLREETSRLDRVVERTNRTILLLRERRAALIAAAVAGQIDVESAA